MKSFPIQTSFAGGEISELVFGRTETEIYQQGAAAAENFIIDSRGPVIDRGGTEHESIRFSSDEFTKLYTFQVNSSLVYNLYFGPSGQLQINQPDGTLPASGLNYAIPHSAAQIRNIRIVIAPSIGSTTIYILHGNVQTQRLLYTHSTDSFAVTAVAFTGKPTTWTGTNWPSCGGIFQGRLWLGNTPSDPNTFWASKSGLYETFTAGALDDDPILGVQLIHPGDIQWIVGTKNLVIGSETGEYIVKSDTGVVSANDIQIERQSQYGSAFVDALLIGNRIFYISADGTRIRMMEYAFSRDNWISDEANYFASHLAENGVTFTQIAWAPNPDSLLIAVLSDGRATYYTWEDEVEIHGWSPFITQGDVISVTAGLINGLSVITWCINRPNSGSTLLNFEHSRLLSNDPIYYMDDWVEGTIGGDLRTITGLDHLNGFLVQVLVDGSATHTADKTVAAGTIVLDADAVATVIVGLKYTPRLVTLPIDNGTSQGTSRGHFKQYNKLQLMLIASAIPEINGYRPDAAALSPNIYLTRDVSVTLLGWDKKQQVEFKQDLPLRCNIAAIFGELAEENF